MCDKKHNTQISKSQNLLTPLNVDDLYLNGENPEFFHLDNGNDSDVGKYIDGTKGKSTVRRIGGLSVPKEPSITEP